MKIPGLWCGSRDSKLAACAAATCGSRPSARAIAIVAICAAMVSLAKAPRADAQYFDPYAAAGAGAESGFTTDAYGDTVMPSVQAGVGTPFAGRTWFAVTGAQNGLGYQGSYLTAGALLPAVTGPLNGMWYVDARPHVSENGGFFGNIGIGRNSFFDPLQSVMGVSMWYDYDGDEYDGFGFPYNQLGVSGIVLNEIADFRVNGYFPFGATDRRLSTNDFTGHNILIQNGLEAALRGFDSRFDIHVPGALSAWQTIIGLGGYYYESREDIVQAFGGFMGTVGTEPIPGLRFDFLINHDDVFRTTGFIQLTLSLGGGARQPARALERMMEPVRRNDHIVRWNQQPILATNPETGELWNVIHVDNTAPGGGNGTIEHPFDTLAEAESASDPFDMIYVQRGDGTTRGMNQGITLQDNQYFFGDGIVNPIDTVEVGLFLLQPIGGSPTITNQIGPAAVTLANDDEVAGFNIVSVDVGIFGDGIDRALLRQNDFRRINEAGIQIQNSEGRLRLLENQFFGGDGDSVRLASHTGSIRANANVIHKSDENGFVVTDLDGTAYFRFNEIQKTGLHGINIVQADGKIKTLANDIDSTGRDGIRIRELTGLLEMRNDQITNATRDGIRVVQSDVIGLFRRSRIDGSFESNLHVLESTGDYLVDAVNITDAIENGVYFENTTGEVTVRESTFRGNGNGALAGMNFGVVDGELDVIVTRNIVNANGTGIIVDASGDINAQIPTTGTINSFIYNNRSINDNFDYGIALWARFGGTNNALVKDNKAINDNGRSGGGGILGSSSEDSILNAFIDDNRIDGSGVANPASAGMLFNFFNDTDAVVNNVILRRNVVSNVNNSGVEFLLTFLARADVDARYETYTGNALAGFRMTTTGASVGRFLYRDSDITENAIGMDLETNSASRSIFTIENSRINENTAANISIDMSGDGIMVFDMFNNEVNDGAGDGLVATVTDNVAFDAQLFMFLDDNEFARNGDDDFSATLGAQGTVDSQICLEMHNNHATSPFILDAQTNNGAISLYDDGTNTPGFVTPTNGIFLVPAFFCEEEVEMNGYRDFP